MSREGLGRFRRRVGRGLGGFEEGGFDLDGFVGYPFQRWEVVESEVRRSLVVCDTQRHRSRSRDGVVVYSCVA